MQLIRRNSETDSIVWMGEGGKMSFLAQLTDNVIFFVEFLAIVLGIVVFSYIFEKIENKHAGYRGRILTTRRIAMVGLFSAISSILMLFEIPMPFAPSFYKIDLSEIPVLIITFAFGPVVGVLTEFCKVMLKLLFKSTSTAFVGELANFCVGCSMILPACIVYMLKKTKKNAIIGCIVGTLFMTVFGSMFNAIYLLPKFAQLYGLPIDALVGMATAINSSVKDINTLVLMCVVPLNLIKGTVVSVITMLLYKKLSPIIKNGER